MSNEKAAAKARSDSLLDRVSAKLSRTEHHLYKLLSNGWYTPSDTAVSSVITTRAKWVSINPPLQKGVIFFAAKARSIPLLQRLRSFGADFNIEGSCDASFGNKDNGWTPLGACFFKDYDDNADGAQQCMRWLLANGADPNFRPKSIGKTVLFRAVEAVKLDIVKLLVEAGADPNSAATEAPRDVKLQVVQLSPVQLAVHIDGGSDIFEYFVTQGKADLHTRVKAVAGVTSFYGQGQNILRYAFYLGRLDCARVILSAMEEMSTEKRKDLVNPLVGKRPEDESATSLHGAAVAGAMDEFRRLMELGADVYATNTAGAYPIHEAVVSRHVKSKTLLELASFTPDVNAKDGFGSTALHCAAREGKWESVKALLHAGADPNIRHATEKSPLELALAIANRNAQWQRDTRARQPGSASLNYVKVVETLVAHGANIPEDLNKKKLDSLRAMERENAKTVHNTRRDRDCPCIVTPLLFERIDNLAELSSAPATTFTLATDFGSMIGGNFGAYDSSGGSWSGGDGGSWGGGGDYGGGGDFGGGGDGGGGGGGGDFGGGGSMM